MSEPASSCCERVLVTPTCSFKLYGVPLGGADVRSLHALASAWIAEATAGFVTADPDGGRLSAFWWEGEDLRRIVLSPDGLTAARRTVEPLAFARLAELPLIAREGESWARHVVHRHRPSLPAYLSDLLA